MLRIALQIHTTGTSRVLWAGVCTYVVWLHDSPMQIGNRTTLNKNMGTVDKNSRHRFRINRKVQLLGVRNPLIYCHWDRTVVTPKPSFSPLQIVGLPTILTYCNWINKVLVIWAVFWFAISMAVLPVALYEYGIFCPFWFDAYVHRRQQLLDLWNKKSSLNNHSIHWVIPYSLWLYISFSQRNSSDCFIPAVELQIVNLNNKF